MLINGLSNLKEPNVDCGCDYHYAILFGNTKPYSHITKEESKMVVEVHSSQMIQTLPRLMFPRFLKKICCHDIRVFEVSWSHCNYIANLHNCKLYLSGISLKIKYCEK